MYGPSSLRKLHVSAVGGGVHKTSGLKEGYQEIYGVCSLSIVQCEGELFYPKLAVQLKYWKWTKRNLMQLKYWKRTKKNLMESLHALSNTGDSEMLHKLWCNPSTETRLSKTYNDGLSSQSSTTMWWITVVHKIYDANYWKKTYYQEFNGVTSL